jgi:hypothetical protein
VCLRSGIKLMDESGMEVIVDWDGCSNSVQFTCVESPCFARESTHTCRLLSADATPAGAYGDCFGGRSEGVAEKVLMSALRSGDRVLSTMDEIASVIVNQHAKVSMYTGMLNIKHSAGSLELTPDHILPVDGKLSPARDVVVGSQLEGGKVESISYTTDAIINALTTSSRILVAGREGLPVVATHAPEWLAAVMLAPAGMFLTRYSFSTTLSRVFPQSVQAFYDEHLEARFGQNHASLDAIVQAVPTPVLVAVIAAFDVVIAAGFLVYKFGAALLAVAAIALVARKARKA